MTLKKDKVIILSSEVDAVKIQTSDQQIFKLNLSEKVLKFNSEKLLVGCVYNISYEDETNTITYAKLSQSSNDLTKYPPENKVKDYTNEYRDKDDLILAQACGKMAVHLSKDMTDWIQLTQEMYQFYKKESYKK